VRNARSKAALMVGIRESRKEEDGRRRPLCDAIDYCSLEQSLPMTRTDATRIF